MPGSRIFGSPPPYQPTRRDASVVFRSLVTQPPPPPRLQFLSTPEPARRPVPDVSDVMTPPFAAAVTSIIRRFFTTDVPVPRYVNLAVTTIRARASAAVFVPEVPVVQFLTTPIPAQQPGDDVSRVMPSLIFAVDPLGGGAFVTTAVPWSQTNRADASMTVRPPFVFPTLVENLRRFLDVPSSAQAPRPDVSIVWLPQTMFTGAAVITPLELRKFLMTPPAWAYWTGWRADASWIIPLPQQPQPLAPPSPRASNVAPQWLRRRRLLFGI